MTAPATNVTPLATARARRLLDDMLEHPFCVLIFKGDDVTGVTKGLDADVALLIRSLIQELSA